MRHRQKRGLNLVVDVAILVNRRQILATLAIVGCNHISTHEIVAITSAGQGYVSFLLEPPAPAGKGAKV